MKKLKEKKLACMFLVAMFTLSLATPMTSVGADAQPKLFIDPQTYIATELGEVFAINIKITNAYDLAGFEFKLGYNTTLLDALGAVEGPLPQPPTSRLVSIHDPEGYIWASIRCSPTEGNGTLAIVIFNATSAGCASCTLHLYDTELIDSHADLIPHEVEDGEYKFGILNLTVTTDKHSYNVEENVTIYGNLTLNNTPHQGLVVLQVYDPTKVVVIRTLQIGPAPPPGEIIIVELRPCNSLGQPRDTFTKGSLAYFYVAVNNSGTEWKNVTITINAFDGSMVPLPGVPTAPIPVAPNSQSDFGPTSIYIPDWANTGNGTVYACAFTDMLGQGGIPYCPEASATFQITGGYGETGTTAEQTSENPGNYSLTFKLPPYPTGLYHVYATSSYKRQTVTDNTLFGVNVISVPDNYPTIQAAVNAATPTNNTILVFPGTYNEHVIINKTVTLIGVDPSNTIINGSGTGTVVTVTADNAEIAGFTIQNGNYGIMIASSDNNHIFDNTLSNNNHGIYLNYSTSTTLEDNNMICNKCNFGVFGESLSHFIHDIDTSNTVDGKPIIYWINKQDEPIPSNAGFVAIVNSKEIVVRGLNLTNEGQGLLLAFTTDSLIERVNMANNEYGIYQVSSDGNTIVANEVPNNTVGIYQSYCDENIICHNNFNNNTNQVEIYQSSNTWNDPAGKGNYWSNYTGADLNGDGVGDTLLPHQDVDWYPLMAPYVLMHDIAITNVTFVLPCNESQLYPGWVINATVTVRNEGDFTENFFNIIAYYDENPFDMKTVTELTPWAETAINLTWDTEGVSPGNHTISAEASVVSGETETTDNIYIDGNVTLLVPTAPHDVALTSITPILPYNASEAYAHWVIDVTVTVENEGHFKETFNVTAYYDENLIETKIVTLYPLENKTINLTWDTEGVSPGNHTIKANATLGGDANPANDEIVDGTVKFRLWGDVNGNGIVDLGDVGKLDLIYSAIILPPYYPLMPDVNGNGVVDLGDVGKLDLIYSGLL